MSEERRTRSLPLSAATTNREAADQVRSAPLEVRRWIEREVTAAVALLQGVEHDPSQLHETALAACTLQEAAEVYELIRGNFLLSQVFFELAREAGRNRGEAPLRFGSSVRFTRMKSSTHD